MNTETFVARAAKKHHGKYDYTDTVYVDSRSKLIISCPLHGKFRLVAAKHLYERGCPKCGMLRKAELRTSNLEVFIMKARQLHGDRFSYHPTVYTKAINDVIITCSIHGDFNQSPNRHLTGSGCPCCGKIAIGNATRKTIDHFLKTARIIHGERYDYSDSVYVGSQSKISIICRTHGPFRQTVTHHLQGKGCPGCKAVKTSIRKRGDLASFLAKARNKHDQYTYENVVYVHSEEKVNITCPKHGDFPQIPKNHLSGQGCPRCFESHGERVVRIMLDRAGVDFEQEYRFPDCRYRRALPFDFAVVADGQVCGLIEFHGEQHYGILDEMYGMDQSRSEKMAVEIARRDQIKIAYCATNNIPLLVIPHWDLANVETLVTSFLLSLPACSQPIAA
jgi:hypothetical protein